MGTAMDDFSHALRALMAEHGVGVRALARQVPCDHALVSRLSSGERPPSAAMARRLDEILGAEGGLITAAGPGPWSGRGELPLAAPVLVRAISRVTLGDLGKTGLAVRPHRGRPDRVDPARRHPWAHRPGRDRQRAHPDRAALPPHHAAARRARAARG
jgi:transcriptional regulator with XRE-family HTH domain